MEPLVSVILPTYNRSKLLKRSIKSVLKQTINNLEIIIVDDYSTDNTIEYVNYLRKNDNRIRLFVNKGIKGPSNARNIGIINSRAKYIGLLDSDDEYKKEHIERALNFLETYDFDIVFSDLKKVLGENIIYRSIFKEYHFMKKIKLKEIEKKKEYYLIEDNINFIRKTILKNINIITTSTIVYNKNKINFLFNENFSHNEDQIFFLECLMNGKKIGFINKVGIKRYQTEGSLFRPNNYIGEIKKLKDELNAKKYFLDKYNKKMQIRDQKNFNINIADHENMIGNIYLEFSKYKRALCYYFKAKKNYKIQNLKKLIYICYKTVMCFNEMKRNRSQGYESKS